MPIPYNPTAQDGRAIREKNRLTVLQALRSFGQLRRPEIARLLWPNSSTRSAYQMAVRTCSGLIADGLVFERTNTFRDKSLALSNRGANLLNNRGFKAQPGHNLNFTGSQFFHRTLGNAYLVEKAARGDGVWPEYGLISNQFALGPDWFRAAAGKIPDGIVRIENEDLGLIHGEFAIEWIEVESSFKPQKELYRILDTARRLGDFLTPRVNLAVFEERGQRVEVFMDKLVLVYDANQGHERNILRAVRRYLKEHEISPDVDWLTRIVMARCYVDIPFVWRGLDELPLTVLLNSDSALDPESEIIMNPEQFSSEELDEAAENF